jgi:hypothetical protein
MRHLMILLFLAVILREAEDLLFAGAVSISSQPVATGVGMISASTNTGRDSRSQREP